MTREIAIAVLTLAVLSGCACGRASRMPARTLSWGDVRAVESVLARRGDAVAAASVIAGRVVVVGRLFDQRGQDAVLVDWADSGAPASLRLRLPSGRTLSEGIYVCCGEAALVSNAPTPVEVTDDSELRRHPWGSPVVVCVSNFECVGPPSFPDATDVSRRVAAFIASVCGR